jgi:hypothetical protein
MSTPLSDLLLLEEKWKKEYSKQSTGGSTALKGFHYQFLVVLLEAIQEWLKKEKKEQNEPTVFTEILSDIVNSSCTDKIVISQSKYTQSSNSVISALKELFLIHKLAVKEIPKLSQNLCYQIISAEIDPKYKDVRGTINRWTPDNLPSDNPDLVEFRQKVAAKLVPNPSTELLALIANTPFRAKNPLKWINDEIGQLFRAVSQDDVHSAANHIWSALLELTRTEEDKRNPIGITFWSSENRPPQKIEEGKYLVGEQPSLENLRNGYFSPRTKTYSNLTVSATNWLNSCHVEERTALPLFWIQGRSGCGKSVALLHLLSNLEQQGYGPILWLGNKVNLLPEAIRLSRDLQESQSQQVLIGLDDPCSPEKADAVQAWQQAVTLLEDIRQGGNKDLLPVLFCCGPTEQSRWLEDEFSDEVSLEIYELPETSEDIYELQDWFRQRTLTKPIL